MGSGILSLNALDWAVMQSVRTQRPATMLVIYMITALLFLTSVKIHIHDHEAAATADHGYAVSITALTDDILPASASDEISVSPDSVLKLKQNNFSLLAVFLLIAVVLTVICRTFVGRLRESHTRLPVIPFRGTPPLRAPPLL